MTKPTPQHEFAFIESWAARLREEMRRRGTSVQELAQEAHVPRATLANWLGARNPPDPWKLPALAELLSVPVLEQYQLLGWLGPTVDASTPTVAHRRYESDLWRATGEVEAAVELLTGAARRLLPRGFTADVANQVLAPIDGIPEGRWEARIAFRRDGDRYADGEAYVEFALADGRGPLSWQEIDRYFSDNYIVARARRTEDLEDRIERERIEIRSIVNREHLAEYGIWLGKGGEAWRSLARMERHSSGRSWTHLFLPLEQLRSLPRASDPVTGVRYRGEEVSRVYIFGPTYNAADEVARLLGPALGWATENLEQRTSERYGRPSRYSAPERTRNIESVTEQWLKRDERFVIGANTRPDALTTDLLDILSRSNNTLAVLLEPPLAMAEAWEGLQRDHRQSSGVDISDFSRATRIAAACQTMRTQLREHTRFLRLDLTPSSPRVAYDHFFRDPQIFDGFVRAAAQIVTRLGAEPQSGPLLKWKPLLVEDRELSRLLTD